MISAHPNGQIFLDLVICPYCSMGEESIHIVQLLTPLSLKVAYKNGQITPDSMTHPWYIPG